MLTDDMIRSIEHTELFPLSTASWDGMPNVIPIKFMGVMDPQRVWIADNYLSKTLRNLEENPYAAFYVMSPERDTCWQFKGATSVHQEGEAFAAMRERVRKLKPDAPARALVVLEVEEIYDCRPGPSAGQLLWSAKPASTFDSCECNEK